jgi:hypothetical protein
MPRRTKPSFVAIAILPAILLKTIPKPPQQSDYITTRHILIRRERGHDIPNHIDRQDNRMPLARIQHPRDAGTSLS